MIYCFDMDGVICNTDGNKYWGSFPYRDVIRDINTLYEKGHIIKIFTGRGYTSGMDWLILTKAQLQQWGVRYHELIMGKPSYDVFIDDKAINIKDWKGGL